ncbi:MAG: transposase [Chloroflexi bacterium]|nr:transposase [Chloroflexota bacterium]
MALVLALCAQLDRQHQRITLLEAQLQECPAQQTETAALQELVTSLQAEQTTLQSRLTALKAEVQELRTRLGQDSSNSSRPPSSDPPQASAKNKAQRKPAPSGRQRGGQPGHPGRFRGLLTVEQVTQVVVVAPEGCRHCEQPFPLAEPRRRSRAWRHQVVELVGSLTVHITAYQRQVRRCSPCGERTRSALPAGVPASAFGPRLTAVVALFTGRFRLSHREVRQVMTDLWDVAVSLGAIERLQQVQSSALSAPYTEARGAVLKADVVNMGETSWREDKQRAWLWTVVTASLTVFLIDPSRGSVVVDVLLGAEYAGIVGSDRYSA